MKKSLSVVAAVVVSTAAVAASAQSDAAAQAPNARLAGSAGQVTVDRGQGFVASDASTALRAGEVVRTTSATQIVFADGCSIPLAAGQALTIPSVSPCAAGAGAGSGAVTSASTGAFAPIGGTGVVVGGLAAGGLVAVVATAADDDDDAPISR